MKNQDVSELSTHFHSAHGGWYEEGIRIQIVKLVVKVGFTLIFCDFTQNFVRRIIQTFKKH